MSNFYSAWCYFFCYRTPAQVAAVELAEAELSLLEAQTGLDYAVSVVHYHTARIARLRRMIGTDHA